MKKLLLACLFIACCQITFAQYADLGGGSLKNKIWWFDWAGLNIVDGASRTFQINGEMEVSISFSKVNGLQVTPSIMNTWEGSLLVQSYDFSNFNIKPALLTPASTSDSKFSISVSVRRNGNTVPFSFIAADAESSSPDEQIKLVTSGGNWKSIEFFRNSTQTSNPLNGCNTKSITITNTQDLPSYPSNKGHQELLYM